MADLDTKASDSDTVISVFLARARTGDRQALGELLECYRPALKRLASQLLYPGLAQKIAASDLIQETWLDAIRDFGAARLDEVPVLEAWLMTLLSNNFRDWQRKFELSQKRELRRELPLEEFLPHGQPAGAEFASPESSPATHAVRLESAQLINSALMRLSRGYRQIIIWRTHERQSWQEIAERLNRSEDAVRMLWKRAVARLKAEVLKSP